MECVSSEGVNQGLRGQGEGTQAGMRRADFGPAVRGAELAGEAGDRAVQAAVHGPRRPPSSRELEARLWWWRLPGGTWKGSPVALSGCWHGGWWEVVVGRSRAWHGRVSMSER